MDLSLHHAPITDLFLAEVSRHTPEVREEFEASGYLKGVPILTAAQIAVLRDELDVLMDEHSDDPRFYEVHTNESKEDGRNLFHALGAWRISEAFHDLLFHRSILNIAEELLGGPVRFWHDQVFVKPANNGAVVAWHQDYSYWTRTVPMAHLTCWIGLDDSDVTNGCVHYVPGSHRWHLLPRGELANDMTAVLKHLNAEQKDEFKPVPVEMKAGEASFHHPMMVHGSYENNSDRPRRGVVLNFIRDGVRSNSNEPLLEGVPLIPMGQRIEGQFFPLLSQASE